jgi:hypothetical protein
MNLTLGGICINRKDPHPHPSPKGVENIRRYHFARKIFFYIILFTKVQINVSRYEAPREETREAYGCLAIGCTKDNVVALSVFRITAEGGGESR